MDIITVTLRSVDPELLYAVKPFREARAKCHIARVGKVCRALGQEGLARISAVLGGWPCLLGKS